MKLHIEVLQEKLEAVGKEREVAKREAEKAGAEGKAEAAKMGQAIKALEEELAGKVQRLKALEGKVREGREERRGLVERISALQGQYERLVARVGGAEVVGPSETMPDYSDGVRSYNL
jgi:predicted  nucleic acid-binding Zn-ribbon protein